MDGLTFFRLFFCLFAGVLIFAAPAYPQVRGSVTKIRWNQNPDGSEEVPAVSAEMELKLVELVNKLRKSRGLRPLKVDASLTKAARYHAADMANQGYFEHDTYNVRHGELRQELPTFDRVRKFIKGDLLARGENIAGGQVDEVEAFEAWRTSPGHFQCMIDPAAVWIGIGFYFKEDSEDGSYWVLDTGMNPRAPENNKKRRTSSGLRRIFRAVFKS